MKIVDKTSKPEVKSVKDISIGTVFYGAVQSGGVSLLLLRTYNGLVNLSNPSLTWYVDPGDRDTKFEISNYKPLKVELVILGEADFE